MSESHPTPEQPDATGQPHTGGTPAGGAASSRPTGGNPLATMDKLDLATIAAGVLVLVASLMPYYTMSFEGFEGLPGTSSSESTNAWGEGFFGWFGALCALAAAAVLAAHLFGVKLPVPVRLVVLALFGAALLFTLLALFVFPGESCEDSLGALGGKEICDSLDEGRGFGYWLALLSAIAGTALAAMRRKAA